MKYVDTAITFEEFPDETTLCINISNCPCHCEGCHSSYLAQDIGNELTINELEGLIKANPGITCVGFMGGDAEPLEVSKLAYWVKHNTKLNVGWYSGRTWENKGGVVLPVDNRWFNYIKLGPYMKDRGGLSSRITNQRMYYNTGLSSDTSRMIGWQDITRRFWK